MRWSDGLALVKRGLDEAQNAKLWQLYCSVYPHMNEDNFQTFEQWKDAIIKPAVEVKPKAEIMRTVRGIIDMTVR